MEVPKFGILEQTFQHAGSYSNPYVACSATAQFTPPNGGGKREIPLFWDGGTTWRFRFSPDEVGTWSWVTRSSDSGLDDKSGTFDVVASDRQGSIRLMTGHPHHFERQDGSRFWFLGETAWSLYLDSEEEKHDRATAERHIDVRAEQGFNVMHSMLLSELGWGNCGGDPFSDLAAERINPAYWKEVDLRLSYLNSKNLIGGLVVAWARKRRDDSEPFAWDRFPDFAAKLRYARYIAARYSAYDVYFIVAGEWNASARDRDDADAVRQEYVEIGDALQAADPHQRMIGIHPGTGGVYFVRKFHDLAGWMSFGDYQQNYRNLNAEIVASRGFGKPVINSEYAYYLRDAHHDGLVDKPNSQSLEVTRGATWDIVMGGGYVVSGFGSTYLGGARNVGPFALDAPQNDDWEAQIQHVPALFEATEWWRLEPRNDLISSSVARSDDRQIDGPPAPPTTVYWCLAEPGEQYVVYARGLTARIHLFLSAPVQNYRVRQFDPRTGAFEDLGVQQDISSFAYQPPDDRDWVILLQKAE